MANYLSFNPSNALGILHQYLRSDGSFPVEEVYSFETKRHQVDLDDAHGTPIRHTWKNLMTIGKAKEGLYADVQEQLRYVQERISFRYLRFHGIFDDDMMVYGEDPAGNPQFNFRYVDQWFDFLLSIGLKPFVELGFMPSDLASDKSKTVFYNPSYTSPPKSLDKWCEWVDGFLRHCINRYGIKEVENWKFEFWNEPEVYVFWSGTEAEYREFYRCTYETIKGISTRLQVGASAGTIPQLTSVASRDVFFSFCRNNQCLPDFIPVHFYPHDPGEARTEQEWIDLLPLQFDPNLIKEFIPISSDPDFLKRILAEEKEGLSAQNLSHLDLYLTEWNATACHRELTNDTLQAC